MAITKIDKNTVGDHFDQLSTEVSWQTKNVHQTQTTYRKKPVGRKLLTKKLWYTVEEFFWEIG